MEGLADLEPALSCNSGLPRALLHPGPASYLLRAFLPRNAEEGHFVISETFNTQERQGGDWDPYQGRDMGLGVGGTPSLLCLPSACHPIV